MSNTIELTVATNSGDEVILEVSDRMEGFQPGGVIPLVEEYEELTCLGFSPTGELVEMVLGGEGTVGGVVVGGGLLVNSGFATVSEDWPLGEFWLGTDGTTFTPPVGLQIKLGQVVQKGLAIIRVEAQKQ